MKRYYIQLTPNSEWIEELGESLAHVMAYVATYDTIPYAYFTKPY